MLRLKSLSLTSFDSFTDMSISRLVMEQKHLNNLCLRDNCQLTIKTLEACIDAARASPERTLNVQMDEKQMSASKLLVKYATSYIRSKWHSKHGPLASEWIDAEKPDNLRSEMTESIYQPNEYDRWPTNLNVIIDENLR